MIVGRSHDDGGGGRGGEDRALGGDADFEFAAAGIGELLPPTCLVSRLSPSFSTSPPHTECPMCRSYLARAVQFGGLGCNLLARKLASQLLELALLLAQRCGAVCSWQGPVSTRHRLACSSGGLPRFPRPAAQPGGLESLSRHNRDVGGSPRNELKLMPSAAFWVLLLENKACARVDGGVIGPLADQGWCVWGGRRGGGGRRFESRFGP